MWTTIAPASFHDIATRAGGGGAGLGGAAVVVFGGGGFLAVVVVTGTGGGLGAACFGLAPWWRNSARIAVVARSAVPVKKRSLGFTNVFIAHYPVRRRRVAAPKDSASTMQPQITATSAVKCPSSVSEAVWARAS